MLFGSTLILVVYAIFIVRYIYGNNKLEIIQPIQELKFTVSVVVPFRNEQSNLASLCQALLNQNCSPKSLELIFINDFSTDDSHKVIQTSCVNSPFQFQIINLTEGQGKKAAITKGVEMSKGEFILTTDADCVMSSEWVNSMMVVHLKYHADFLIGPVKLQSEMAWFSAFQEIEFAAIMACTSGSASIGNPIACNGANLGFSKKLFSELQPYQNNITIASGDDVFFLHQAKKNRKEIKYVANPLAMVKSEMAESFNAFRNQRIRWAQKSRYFKDQNSLYFGISVILIQLVLWILVFISFFSTDFYLSFLLIFGVKYILDLWLLNSTRKWNRVKHLFWKSIMLSFLYPVYFLSFAGLSLLGKSNWKGRKV